MVKKLQKEKMLYETLVNKTSDKSFMVSFHDYFSFILKEGVELCAHLNEPMKERDDESKKLEALYIEIITSVKESIKNIEAFLKKEKLEDDYLFNDRLKDTHSLIDNTTYVIDGERLDSIHSEMSDITRKLYELGFEKEVSKYVKLGKDSKPNTEDIIALEKRKQFITERNNFTKKDARSLAGAFIRLGGLYISIEKAENSTGKKIRIENLFEDLGERNRDIEYTKLMAGDILEGSYFKREKYISDLERFHQSITMNNSEEDINKDKTNAVFSLKGNDIYHCEIGRLKYELNGLNDPKYIKAFKNVIRYMPTDTHKIRISMLESVIDKKDKIGKNYRVNIGKSSRSFNGFLRKNGVRNVHPVTNEVVIAATDEYITFNNILESV